MLRSIAPSSTGVASHLCLSSADFITIIAESNFRYRQPKQIVRTSGRKLHNDGNCSLRPSALGWNKWRHADDRQEYGRQHPSKLSRHPEADDHAFTPLERRASRRFGTILVALRPRSSEIA